MRITITQANTNSWTPNIIQQAMEMESPVVARSGQINMSIRRILSLQPGDIIDLPYNPDQPLTILAEDQPLFIAIPGERNGKKAFHITSRHSSKGGVHGTA